MSWLPFAPFYRMTDAFQLLPVGILWVEEVGRVRHPALFLEELWLSR